MGEVTFQQRVERLVHERGAVARLLRREGPQLVERLISDWGSLRKAAAKSGYSPAYLSQVVNGKSVLSPSAYLDLLKKVR